MCLCRKNKNRPFYGSSPLKRPIPTFYYKPYALNVGCLPRTMLTLPCRQGANNQQAFPNSTFIKAC